VLDEPGPSVSLANFNIDTVDCLLTYWVDDAARMGKVNADIRLMLLKALENEKMPVATPT
jgi:small-conductance mechanosensitive channel